MKNKLIDLGHCLAIELNGGHLCLFDRQDLAIVSERYWMPTKPARVWYAIAGHGSHQIYMHRLILGLPNSITDHKDGNGLNNQRSNLRTATKSQNTANRPKPSNNTSGYKGVLKAKNGSAGWCATICLNYKSKYLGRFPTKEDAARAYDKSAIELFGEYARTNFPQNL